MAAAVPYLLAATTVASTQQQRSARKERKRANALERRRAEVVNLRERKKALAARMRASAQASVAGQEAGVGAGAGVVLAEQASLGSQFGSNVGFAAEVAAIQDQRSAALESAAAKEGRAQTFQAIGAGFAAVNGSFQKAKAGGG